MDLKIWSANEDGVVAKTAGIKAVELKAPLRGGNIFHRLSTN
jgi:hypothetical protein